MLMAIFAPRKPSLGDTPRAFHRHTQRDAAIGCRSLGKGPTYPSVVSISSPFRIGQRFSPRAASEWKTAMAPKASLAA